MTINFLLGALVMLCVVVVGLLTSPVYAFMLAVVCAVVYMIAFAATLKL